MKWNYFIEILDYSENGPISIEYSRSKLFNQWQEKLFKTNMRHKKSVQELKNYWRRILAISNQGRKEF
jgi:hypothetical protein